MTTLPAPGRCVYPRRNFPMAVVIRAMPVCASVYEMELPLTIRTLHEPSAPPGHHDVPDVYPSFSGGCDPGLPERGGERGFRVRAGKNNPCLPGVSGLQRGIEWQPRRARRHAQ